MLVVLSIACWLSLWIVFGSRRSCWRRAFLEASVIWATYAIVVTELLSLFSALTQSAVAIAWAIALLGCVVAASRLRLSFDQLTNSVKTGGTPSFPGLAICMMVLIALTLGCIAVFCPPNNYDSLTYHLSRIEHWISNGSVAHYPVHVLRQLTLNPGAEFLILQLRLLSGSDYLSNFLQWFAMVGSVLVASLVAKQLGAGTRGQTLAAVVCMSIPIGILESTSTQNDYVAAFWLLSLTSICLSWVNDENKANFKYAIWAGLCLGLSALTKATAYFFALPIVVLLAVALLKRFRQKALLPLFATAAIALILNLPFAIRNTLVFGSPVISHCVYGPGYRAANDSLDPKYAVSNVMRNLAVELQTPVPVCNRVIFGGISRIHRLLGWDPSDPSSTFDAVPFEAKHPAYQFLEDIAGNPLHTVLFLVCLGCVIFFQGWTDRRKLLPVALSIVGAFLLFSLCLKWQPWHTRLLLPLYVIGAAFVGSTLSRLPNKYQKALLAMLIIYALPYVFININKPIIGDENIFVTARDENYFRGVPNYYDSYASACDFLAKRNASRIGVVSEDNGWCEYPLWVLLSRNFSQPATVLGLSAPRWAQFKGQAPDALISFDRLAPDTISIPGRVYSKSLRCDSTRDTKTYHLWGLSRNKDYSHLFMSVFLPNDNILSGVGEK